MFSFIRYYLDLLIDKIFALYYSPRTKKIPKPRNKLVLASATTLALKIRRCEATSEEVVQAFIDRIKEVNPILNAVVDERFDDAIKEAQNVDRDIARGDVTEEDFRRKPFLGVPFTTKEVIKARGLSNTLGLIRRKSEKAAFDADVVRNMKQSGAILIGVTNVPQISAWQETRNPIYGTTNNPYDTARTAGGSSGGEASIIAACGSPMGIGTEMGGSVRIPAYMCGLFGHKPTNGVVSMNGIMFNTKDEHNSMSLAGTIVRYSEDIIPSLKVLAGENVDQMKLDQSVDVKNLKIYYVVDPKDPYVSPMREEMGNVMMKVVEYFEQKLPDKPELLDIEELKYGGKLWFYWLSQESNIRFTETLANREGEISRVTEILKFCLRCSDYNVGVIMVLLAGFIPNDEPKVAQKRTDLLKSKLMAALGPDTVLLYPSAPLPPSYHHTEIFRPCNSNLFSIWNILECPVTQVPLGLNKEGLPVGIQVVAGPFQDHLTIAVAKELERAFGGYVPPFESDNNVLKS